MIAYLPEIKGLRYGLSFLERRERSLHGSRVRLAEAADIEA